MIMRPPEDPDRIRKASDVAVETVHGLQQRGGTSIRQPDAEQQKQRAGRPSQCFDAEHGVVDEIDETGAESFPASDPPGRW